MKGSLLAKSPLEWRLEGGEEGKTKEYTSSPLLFFSGGRGRGRRGRGVELTGSRNPFQYDLTKNISCSATKARVHRKVGKMKTLLELY